MSRSLVTVPLCCCLLAFRLAAQKCDAVKSAPDSAQAELDGWFAVSGSGDSISFTYADSLAEGMRAIMRAPDPLPVTVWLIENKTIPFASGDFAFTVNADGTVGEVRLLRSTFVGAIDSATMAALQGLDSTHVRRGERVRIVMHEYLTVSSVPTGMPATSAPPGTHIHTFPHRVNVAVLAHPVPVWPQMPFPKVESSPYGGPRVGNLAGHTTLSIVIDERGHVVRGSERQMPPLNDDLFDAAVNLVRRDDFTPVVLGGCAVKAAVLTPFTFGNP